MFVYSLHFSIISSFKHSSHTRVKLSRIVQERSLGLECYTHVMCDVQITI